MTISTDPRLDKAIDSPLAEGYGTISIRVVILDKTMAASAAPSLDDEAPADAASDELLPETGKLPVSSFLEEPKRGRGVCVFLINGQRQHVWDNQFIMRDLELKYLRNRMLVVVDCDGLRPHAIADLMQGSRHQFYEGKVYAALEARVLSALKGDPDLRQFEEEAEDEIASLQAGDEAVKSALDQLIESHHDAADRVNHGHTQSGDSSRQEGAPGALVLTQDVVTEDAPTVGTLGSEPVLQLRPDISTIRLKPNEERRVTIAAKPDSAWKALNGMTLTFDPPVKELQVVRKPQLAGEDVAFTFAESEEFDHDEYPIVTTLRVTAMFTGSAETRLLERRVVITPTKKSPPPPPPKPLSDDPTFLRVTSRQPIRILTGGPDVHVKLKWDGKDELVTGASPTWTFRVSCESPSVDPPTFVTSPVAGRFELLIQAAAGLKAGEQLKFDVEAMGPGKLLSTAFLVDIVDPPTPRKTTSKLPGGGQRRPPYALIYLKREQWGGPNLTCFGQPWTGAEPGSFDIPSATSPLTIFINQDTDLLTVYRDALIAKKSAESTIQQRINKYTAHVAFHLYQMYENHKNAAARRDGDQEIPTELQMRDEIQRVAATLIKLMEVAA
jgi:hypothetical protein